MTELETQIWNTVHNWCDAQSNEIPDQNRRYLMDKIKALVLSDVSPKIDYSRGITTQCTNAQLFAAAPEILKELIDFCKTFESTIGYQRYDHNVFVALNDRYIKSKKAINKALGL